MPTVVVVDTNILFSALLRADTLFADTILQGEHRFVVNELVLTELFHHREKIAQVSRLSDESITQLYYRLIRRVELYREDLISPEVRKQAYKLCRDIDETDAPHVAITIEVNGLLWTGDKRLKAGLQSQGFDRFFDPSPSQ
ncbi:DNA-binding protein [Longimonas halophila]|uniref:DNA-binding protein n=1 Tax=Longimonas halophila TaxID=1469170 RepID=A0A2H3NY58_9BACT|nr:PIN domain-containing protein [Longimonas halophila]PEN07657.1 DNA-binding protein [Longimonas halophila]